MTDGPVGRGRVVDQVRVLFRTGVSLATHAGEAIMVENAFAPLMRDIDKSMYTFRHHALDIDAAQPDA